MTFWKTVAANIVAQMIVMFMWTLAYAMLLLMFIKDTGKMA